MRHWIRARSALAIAAVLGFAALAGCVGDETGGATIDTNKTPTAGDDDTMNAGPVGPTQGETFEAFREAMSLLSGTESAEEPPRMALTGSLVASGGEEDSSFELAALIDVEKSLAVFTLEQSGDAGANPFAGAGPMKFVFGQVHKTEFFGLPPTVVGTYNASAEPAKSIRDLERIAGSSAGSPGAAGDLFDPDEFLTAAEAALAAGALDGEVIEHDGKPALKLTFETTEDNSTVDLSAIVWTEPARLARLDANVVEPADEDSAARDVTFRLEFAYGADAVHDHEEALLRAETMTLLDKESTSAGAGGMFGGFGGGDADSANKTYTVQPSRVEGGLLALDEVTARVYDGMPSGDTEPVLTLDLEAGSAETEDVRLTFEDADANGKVSAGDRILLVQLDAEEADANETSPYGSSKSYVVTLLDEKTGLQVAPGAGLLGALAALGAALVAASSRRRA